jgi:hypothetical protein
MPAMRQPNDPHLLLSINDAPVASLMNVPPAGEGEPDTLTLPASPGVAIFEDRQDQAVFIAVSGNLRELARRRLLTPSPDQPRSWHTDYRAITSRVLAIPAASSLEAEAIYLHHAQTRLPLAYATVIERWRPWFVQVDADAEHPEWGKTNLPASATAPARPRQASKGVAPRSSDSCLTLGPIRDKDAAGRMIELTVDGFDLCRYPNLLAQSPHAAACAYKEMGRCPAPCDGSEPMPAYRARVREAAEAVCASTRPAIRAQFESRMRDAAERHDFELAARCKRALDRMTQLDAPASAFAEDLSRWNLAIVTRAPRVRAARVLAFVGLRIVPIADALVPDMRSAQAAAHDLTAALHTLARSASDTRSAAVHMNHIAAVARFLALPAKKRRAEALAIDDRLTSASLAKALSKLARAADSEPSPEIEDQSVEPL